MPTGHFNVDFFTFDINAFTSIFNTRCRFDNKINITKAIDLFIKNLKSFKKDIDKKNNKSILKKLVQTKKVRTKIIKLKQDIDKPDFGRD